MKTPKKHYRFNLASRTFVGFTSTLVLGALIVGSGLAEGGQGQTGGLGDDTKKDKGQSTGTAPATPTVVGGGQGGDNKGSSTPTPVGSPNVLPGLGAGAGQQTPVPATTGGGSGGVVVVQSPQQQPQQNTGTPGQQLPLAPPSEVAKILSQHKFTGAKGLPLFGYANFESARTGLVARQAAINSPSYIQNVDPTKGPVGPGVPGLVGISMPSPERYQLGAGDQMTLRVSSPTQDPTTQDLIVDSVGAVVVPQTGEKIIARGQTLAQFQDNLKLAVRKGVKNAEVQLQMKELRTMTVYIFGQSFAPGTYQMPSIMSLFNAIYMSGGPNENGSLRRVQLRRTNGIVKEYDLYKLMIDGDRKQDVPLQPGDVITILHAGDRVAFEGEVAEPAVYELKAGEKLQSLIHWSGGIKPSGVVQKISIEKTVSSTERRLIDANADLRDDNNNPVLHDGDDVNIYSIRQDIVNEVIVEGPVDQPHRYGLTNGMRVADLIDAARGLLPEAYVERADLFRRNDDNTHKLIPIDLKRALRRDSSANLLLKEDDRLVVYRQADIQWMGDRKVEVKGAVNKAGTFSRSDNLSVRDVLLQAGGLAPDAYPTLAFLQRTNLDGTVGPLFKINLIKAQLGDQENNIVFQDRDVLTVFSVKDASFIPEQIVTIKGAIQKPGVFQLSPHLTVRDVLLQSGNLLPTAYTDHAFIQRTNLDGTPGPIITFNVTGALNGDRANNPELFPRDVIVIYTEAEAQFMPEFSVSIKGAVQKPGSFPLSNNMTVRDAILLAGNTLPTAHLDHGFIQRTNLDGTPGPLITFNINRALTGIPSDNPKLYSKDMIMIYTIDQEEYRAKQVVDVVGAVQTPSQYVLSKGMRVHDLVAIAGNTLPTAYTERAYLQRVNLDGTFGELKIINLSKVLNGDPADDFQLQPGDKLSVYTKEETSFIPKQTVSISGAIQKPGSYPRADGMTLQDVLRLSGGATAKASDRIEIAKARVKEGTPIQRLSLQEMMGPAGASVKIEDGDMIAVPEDGRIMEAPMSITVNGQVGNPGPYLVSSNREHLSTLLKRAGGALPNGFLKGAQFLRKPEYLTTDAQQKLAPRILEVLTKVQADEYKRALARSEVDKIRAEIEAGKQSQPSVNLTATGSVTPTSQQTLPGVGPQGNAAPVTPARALVPSDLQPNGNLNINVENALRHPGSVDDIILRDGDVVFIPQIPVSVTISGAVIAPNAVKFEPGKSLGYYVAHAGGLTADAAKDQIIIIRTSGNLMKASLNTRLELGDTVFIPTKVEADHLHDKSADFTNSIAQITNAGLLVAVVHALLK